MNMAIAILVTIYSFVGRVFDAASIAGTEALQSNSSERCRAQTRVPRSRLLVGDVGV